MCWSSSDGDILFSRARSSVTLPCPGVSGLDPADVTELSWVCFGCLETVIVSAEAAVEAELLTLRDGKTSVLHKQGRLRLLQRPAFSLQYEPVDVKDSGVYECRIGGHSTASDGIRLVVQGKGNTAICTCEVSGLSFLSMYFPGKVQSYRREQVKWLVPHSLIGGVTFYVLVRCMCK